MAVELSAGTAGASPTRAAEDATPRAGARWAVEPLSARAAVLRSAAQELATTDWLVQAIAAAAARPVHEVWSAELLPTVDALRWLSRAG